jgi:hypothetical protein
VRLLFTSHTLTVPSGKVLRQGLDSPKVETRFVCTHHVISQPSTAFWRLASRLTAPFRGMLLTRTERPASLSPNGLRAP